MQPDPAPTPASLAATLHARRERMQAQATAQRARLSELESRILARLDQASAQLAEAQESAVAKRADVLRIVQDLERRDLAVTQRESEVRLAAAEIEARAAEVASREANITAQLERIAEDRAACERESAALQTAQAAFHSEQQAAANERDLLLIAAEQQARQAGEKLLAYERALADLAEVQTATQMQRRRIAEQLSRQHTAQWEAARAQALQAEKALSAERTACEAERAELTRATLEVAAQADAVAQQQALLARREATMLEHEQAAARQREAAQQAWNDQEAAQSAREEELDARAARLAQAERLVAVDRQSGLQEVTQLRTRAEEKLAALEREHVELAAERDRTKAQRNRIAEQLKRERETQQQEVKTRLAQLEAISTDNHSSHETLLEDARRECERLSERLRSRGDELAVEMAAAESARAEASALQARLDAETASAATRLASAQAEREQNQLRINELLREQEALRTQIQRQGEANESTAAGHSASAAQVLELTAERDSLKKQLAEAAARLTQQLKPAADDEDRERQIADLTQRYEMAVRDIRDLKHQNEELAKKAAQQPRLAATIPGAPMDWEARKRQLLESLEQDEGDVDEHRHAERLRISQVLEQTSATVQEKQDEIEELKRLLADQSESIQGVAVGAAALGQIYDADDVIRQERARLQQLETEWMEKLRQSEIEMSVQRAQLARAQAAIDEQQRNLDDHGPARDSGNAAEGGGKSKKAPRGRWLSRLGLSEDEK